MLVKIRKKSRKILRKFKDNSKKIPIFNPGNVQNYLGNWVKKKSKEILKKSGPRSKNQTPTVPASNRRHNTKNQIH